jgi:hypothetical protein
MSDAMFWLRARFFPAKFLAEYLVMFQCSQPTRAPLFNTLFRAIAKFHFALYTSLESKEFCL